MPDCISLDEIDFLLRCYGIINEPEKDIEKEEKTCSIIEKNSYVYITQKYKKIIYSHDNTTKLETRTITLDPVGGRIFFTPKNAFSDFTLNNPDYEAIMNSVRRICKNKFGFTPMQESGENNLEKLINFIYYPFWPQLGSLQKTIYSSWPDITFFVKNQRLNTNGLKDVLKKLGIDIPNYVWKMCVNTNIYCVEKYLYLKEIGFREHNIINTIINENTGKILFDIDFSLINYFVSPLKDGKFDFHFSHQNEDQKFFYDSYAQVYGEKKIYKLLKQSVATQTGRETFLIFIQLDQNIALSDTLKQKILTEGFTKYNHDLLLRIYNDAFDIHRNGIKYDFPNVILNYLPIEKEFETIIDGYEFHLVEDLEYLIELGNKMNNCVGSYRRAAATRECLIIYATKNNKYRICIQLNVNNNSYEIVQALGPCNEPLTDKEKNIMLKWQNKFGFKIWI